MDAEFLAKETENFTAELVELSKTKNFSVSINACSFTACLMLVKAAAQAVDFQYDDASKARLIDHLKINIEKNMKYIFDMKNEIEKGNEHAN
jgi:hypothetical protein